MAAAASANGSIGHTQLDTAEAHDTLLTHPHLHPPHARDAHTPPPQKGYEVQQTSYKAVSNGGIDIDGMAICASPAAQQHMRKSKRRRSDEPAEGLGGMARRFAVQHQLGLSLNLMLLVGMSYMLFPSLREGMSAFLCLSYRAQSSLLGRSADGEEKAMYGQGPRDLHLVLSFIVFFTAFRAFMLDYVLMPLAGMCGIRTRKGRVRFAEQAHLLIYYYVYWTWGVYLFARDTPASLPASAGGKLSFDGLLVSMWTHFPRLAVDAQMKVYYLSQMAFWVQQILVIHLEEKRKDYHQMLTHHFITVALMSTSYGFRQLRVGNAVLVCMDIVDLVFPFAKIMKYIGWQKTCDAAFGVFVFAWLFARHLAYGTICWSIYAHVNNTVMPYGTYSLTQQTTTPEGIVSGARLSDNGGDGLLNDIYQPFVNPGVTTLAFNAKIRWAFLGMLGFLQCITLLWFVMIVNVVIRVLKGEGADDTRSDDEGDDEEDDEDISEEKDVADSGLDAEQPKYIEVEAGSDELHYTSGGSKRTSAASSGAKRKGFSSGLNLGERKDILNRIGCLSEEQLAREREKIREGSGSPRPGSR